MQKPVSDAGMLQALNASKTSRAKLVAGASLAVCGLFLPSIAVAAVPGALLISEFRLSGPNGPNDEFIEIYNNSDVVAHVQPLSGGFGVVSSDGILRCRIPAFTNIPPRGHFLCVNSVGYSLASYPAGSGRTATGDATYTTDIPDNMGLALFDSANGPFLLGNRFDSVGSTSETNSMYKEGSGYPALTPSSLEYSFVRRSNGRPLDTNSNADDFIFVDTTGANIGAGQHLGAPGPEPLFSPVFRTGRQLVRFDLCRHFDQSPNLVRDYSANPGANAPFGTLDIRRSVTNTSGAPITRLRFRIIDITTFPAAAGAADLRPITSGDVIATVDRSPCGVETSDVLVRGTTLEQPPNQPNGSGLNGSLSVDSITPGTPLQDGASVDVRFLMGVVQAGAGRFCVAVESIPVSLISVHCVNVSTNAAGTFSNTTAISIPASGSGDPFGAPAAPYPSTVTVSNVTGRVTKVTVTLKQITHTRPSDIDVVLVGPTGVQIVLMSDALSGVLTGQTYTFDAAAAYSLPQTGPSPASGIFQPTNYEAADAFPPPAPASPPASLTQLMAFNGLDPNGTWSLYVVDDASGEVGTIAGGWELAISTSRPAVPLDFDGDRVSDPTLFHPASGVWYIANQFSRSTAGRGFAPVPGDYDGDGRTDAAVFRGSDGTWLLEGLPNVQWGWAGDIPLPADYSGSGRTEIAVYRPAWSGSQWYIQNQQLVVWGLPGDIPVPGDYNGDLSVEIAVYRPLNGTWFIRNGPTITWGSPGDIPVPADYDGDGLTDIAVFRPSTGQWFIRTVSESGPGVVMITVVWGVAGDVPVPADYTGDGVADITVYRPLDSTWFVRGASPLQMNRGGTVPAGRPEVPGDFTWDVTTDVGRYVGDFDGDGTTDIAVYRPSVGTWSVRGQGTVQWGLPGDIPVVGDYDGDRKTDIAVFRPSNATWYIRGGPTVAWGVPGDIPIPADYNGDGVTDIAIYRPSDGIWYVQDQFAVSFGAPGDVPVPGDYDGDGAADVAVYRPGGSVWFARNLFTIEFGTEGDVPVPGDYNGDGVTDIAVFRPDGRWEVMDQMSSLWGVPGDLPVPGDFNGDGVTDVAVFRPSTAEWFVKDQFTVTWGAPGDIPASPAYAPR